MLAVVQTWGFLICSYLRNWSHQSTDFADVDSEGIRNLEETLFQESSSTVRNHTITLHFSETQTTISGTTFDGLARHDLNWASGTRVNLVVHHVAQTLVVCRTEEDLRS